MEIKTERLPVKKKKQAGKIRRRVLRPPKQIPAILNDIIEKLAKQRERWLEANKPPAQLAHVFGEPEEQWNAEKHRTTWNFVFWGDSVVPKDHTTWRDYVGAAFGGNARRHIDQLERLALEGNPDAIKAFAVLTHKMVTTLNCALFPKDPLALKPVALISLNWPVLRGRRQIFSDDHKVLINKLGVGQNAPISKEMLSRVRKNNHTVRIAIAHILRLDSFRQPFGPVPKSEWQRRASQLKPFSIGTWEKWFDVAWTAIEQETSHHPERIPDLRSLGEYKALHSVHSGQQKAATDKTMNCNIKHGAKWKLKCAFRRLAPQE